MIEDKEYPQIPRGAKKSSEGRKTLTLSMILLTMLMAIGLLTSMHFEFEVGADGGKRLTVDFARDRSAPPPEIKTVEPLKSMPEVKAVKPMQSPPEVKTAAQLIETARELIEAGSYKSAFNYCNEVLVLEPNNMSAYVERGRACFYLHRYDEALADLDKAIAAGVPELAVAYNARGCAYLGLKEYKKALNDLDEATRLDPKFRKPYENRIIVYRELSNIESARVKQLN